LVADKPFQILLRSFQSLSPLWLNQGEKSDDRVTIYKPFSCEMIKLLVKSGKVLLLLPIVKIVELSNSKAIDP